MNHNKSWILALALLVATSFAHAGDQGTSTTEPPLPIGPEDLNSVDTPVVETANDDWETPVAALWEALFGTKQEQ